MEGHLPVARVRALLDLVAEVTEMTLGGGDPLPRAADGMLRLVGAKVGAMMLPLSERVAPGTNLNPFVLAGEWPDGVRSELQSFYQVEGGTALDPAAAAILSTLEPGVSVRTRRQLVDDHVWYASSYVKEYRRRWGLDDCIYGSVVLPDGRIGGLGYLRTWGDEPYSEEDRALVQLFTEHTVHFLYLRSDATCSPRESQVLCLLLGGGAAKEIAAHLGISVNTVNQYIQSVYRAEGVSSRAELIAHRLRAVRRSM
jgi:DNA-binding CsgD family transcriptional regulator